MSGRNPEQLLLTNKAGTPVQVQDLMDEGLEGDYEDRIPDLIELMHRGSPEHRLWACMVLTAWGNEDGLTQVAEWARYPERAPWASNPVDFDRIYGADSSMASLADAVRTSFLSASASSLRPLQISAIEALLQASSSHFVDSNLALAIGQDRYVEENLAPRIRDAIANAIARLSAGDQVGFDLAFQTASLVGALAPVDDAGAAHFADVLAANFRSSERMLKELAEALSQGRGPATARSLTALKALGIAAVADKVDNALARRERRGSP